MRMPSVVFVFTSCVQITKQVQFCLGVLAAVWWQIVLVVKELPKAFGSDTATRIQISLLFA
ncbi:hypothetical protein FQZ97_882200 [compost metagenome]